MGADHLSVSVGGRCGRSEEEKLTGRAALRALAANRGRWVRYIRRLLPPCLDKLLESEDIVQHAFVIALERATELTDKSPGERDRWFARVIKNQIRNLVRFYKRRFHLLRVEESEAPNSVLEPTEQSDAELKTMLMEIVELVSQQSETTAILLLWVSSGNSLVEAAEALGIDSSTATRRLARCRRSLERRLGREWK